MSNETVSLLAQLQQNTYTTHDLHRRVGIMRQCVETSLFTDSSLSFVQECEAFLSEQEQGPDVQAVRQWGESVFASFTQANISAKMAALYAEIDVLPLLTLYIPAEFSDEEIVVIGQWCRENCHAAILIDVHIDPEVVGGCGYVWNDTYHEVSLRSKIRENPGVVTSILSEYATA